MVAEFIDSISRRCTERHAHERGSSFVVAHRNTKQQVPCARRRGKEIAKLHSASIYANPLPTDAISREPASLTLFLFYSSRVAKVKQRITTRHEPAGSVVLRQHFLLPSYHLMSEAAGCLFERLWMHLVRCFCRGLPNYCDYHAANVGVRVLRDAANRFLLQPGTKFVNCKGCCRCWLLTHFYFF